MGVKKGDLKEVGANLTVFCYLINNALTRSKICLFLAIGEYVCSRTSIVGFGVQRSRAE